jgi:dipeptidyl aminopeptidase/acylaminoacyl peptidase
MMTRLLPIVLLTAVQTATAQLTPEQVTRIETVTSVAISPDGRHVAYTISRPRAPEEDTVGGQRAFSELWVAETAGDHPNAIVQRPMSAGGQAWSPDGSRLAFLYRGQVYFVPASGGEPRALTTSPTGVVAFQWSPDGLSIAYSARVAEAAGAAERRRRGDDVDVASQRERPTRLWVQPAAGGDARAITPANETVRDFAWAPGSQMLAVQVTETSDVDADMMYRKLYVMRLDGNRTLIPTSGKLGPMAWSTNGATLAFLGATSFNDPLAQSIFVVPAAGGQPTNITPNYEGSVLNLSWQDARTIRFVAVESTRTALNTISMTGGPITRVVGHGAEVFSNASFSRDGNTFAVAASTAQHPNEVFIGDARAKRLRRLTNHNAWLSGVQLGAQETFEWRSRDGWRMEGVLIRPLGAPQNARAPLAILPHGGPEGYNLNGWSTNSLYPAQVLAAQGYAVFMPNYRGSGGRGVAFSKGDHRDLGGREFDDVLDGITALHQRGIADSLRVGISGTSYGGFFSAWAGTKHSDRFRLAMPFAGISNWTSFTGTTDIPVEMAAVHWDLWPYEHPMLMWERSPLAHVGNAKTPMIIGQGMADERVHPEQMIQLYQALKLKGVPADLVLYPREPHGLLERQHQLDYMKRVVDAFNKYVRPAERPTT